MAQGELVSTEIIHNGVKITMSDIPELERVAAGAAAPHRFSNIKEPMKFARTALLKLKMIDLVARYGPRPIMTVDGVLIISKNEAIKFDLDDKKDHLVLIKRGHPPFKGMFALPGGFLEYGETTEDAVVREFREETGLETKVSALVGVYSSPDRDTRWHHVSVAYELRLVGGDLKAGDDAESARLVPVDAIPKLAFDHNSIIKDVLG